MTTRTKSALLLFATLLVGVLLGAFTTSTLHDRRLAEIRALGSRGGLTNQVEAVVEPRDEAQRAALRAALERAEARFTTDRRACRELFGASRDSMRAALTPLLDAEQQARLDEWLARDRRDGRSRRGRDRRERNPR